MPSAKTAPPLATLTWEDYLREPVVHSTYSIVNGERVFEMAGPSFEHQEIVLRLGALLLEYQRATRAGHTLPAPFDVVISMRPLQTRQPDLLFVTNEALDRIGGPHLGTPLTAAPALVVEVLSASETRRERMEKVLDYCRIGVPECWIISPSAESVEVLELTAGGPERVALLGRGDAVRSRVLEGLEIPVDAVFEP